MIPGTPDPAALERREIALRLAGVGLAGATVAVLLASGTAPTPGEIRTWGDGLGPWGPAAWPLVFMGLNLLLPWPVVAGATGLVFGVAVGTVLSMAGILLATAAQFSAARHLLGERIRTRAAGRFPALDAMLARNDVVATFYSRLVPVLPWGIVNYACGLARVRLWPLLLATLTAGAPKIFAYTALGGSLGDLGAPEAKVAVALLVVMAAGGAVVARRRMGARGA